MHKGWLHASRVPIIHLLPSLTKQIITRQNEKRYFIVSAAANWKIKQEGSCTGHMVDKRVFIGAAGKELKGKPVLNIMFPIFTFIIIYSVHHRDIVSFKKMRTPIKFAKNKIYYTSELIHFNIQILSDDRSNNSKHFLLIPIRFCLKVNSI